MQRLAALSFLGVVLVLVAFTVVHETKKPDLAARSWATEHGSVVHR